MRFVLDGTTGLLGRNLLFEILKQNLHQLDEIEIILLGNGANGATLQSRMNEIIIEDGSNYLNLDKNSDCFAHIQSRIIYIDFDLTSPDLGISKEDFELLKQKKIDYFFHIAALLNFGDSEELVKKLKLVNFQSNKILLELVKELGVKEFIYVSTAYSSGSSQFEISPEFINRTGIFRNPYENSKLETEIYLAEFAKRENISYKIFRPSTISGRMIENELGSTSKFDVFYEWARWILKYKMKLQKNPENPYQEPIEINFRIRKHKESLINVVPADHAAKLLYFSSLDGLTDHSFHLVNDKDMTSENIMKYLLDAIKVEGYCFVEEEPEDKTPFEQFYYRTVGKIFTPYIIDPPLHYNNDNVQSVMRENNLKCPEMTEANFQKLMDYAKKHNFGMGKL